MQTLKSYSDQVTQMWRSSTPAARFGIVILSVLCVVVISGVGYWSAQPQMVELAANLEPAKVQEIVTELDRANIAYEIKGAGNVLFVDRNSWPRAQLFAKNAGVGTSTPSVETLSPWDNPLNQEIIKNRNLERVIAGSIRKMKGIQDVDVMLSIPARHPFLRERTEATASISLTLKKNERLSDGHATSIASLVSNAVEGLQPKNISITDTDGNKYSVADQSNGSLNTQEDYRLTREQALAGKAQALLATFMGYENVVVRVSADYIFVDDDTTITKVDPEGKSIVSEDLVSTTDLVEDEMTSPGAGTNSNLGGNSGGNPSSKLVRKKTENSNSVYENSKEIRNTRDRASKLNLLTVSVVANEKALSAEGAMSPSQLKEKIEKVVKQAVGFREGKDEITVEFFPFAEPPPEEAVPASAIPWDQINKIVQNVSLGIAALIAFLVTMMALKKMRPITSEPVAPQLNADSANRVNQLGQLISQNPEVFSRIIAAWADSSAGTTGIVGQGTDFQKKGEDKRAA